MFTGECAFLVTVPQEHSWGFGAGFLTNQDKGRRSVSCCSDTPHSTFDVKNGPYSNYVLWSETSG